MTNGFPTPYGRVMASTRIRVYDVIKFFYTDQDFLLELYNSLRRYDIAVFQKKFDRKAATLAKKLKSGGTKIVLDINVNYYVPSSKYISTEQCRGVTEFTKIVDVVVTTTEFLRNSISKLFPDKKVTVIEESIDDTYFEKRRNNFRERAHNIIWSGYSSKAYEILLIRDVLEEVYEKIKFDLILVSEKDPDLRIGEIPIHFERYNHSKIVQQLQRGDVFIAPRDLSDSYNLGHSFTKIGVAMAAGLPVIASPVPSYLNSPAIICKNKEDWRENLQKVLKDYRLLRNLSSRGHRFTKENYSIHTIKSKYRDLFNSLVEE